MILSFDSHRPQQRLVRLNGHNPRVIVGVGSTDERSKLQHLVSYEK